MNIVFNFDPWMFNVINSSKMNNLKTIQEFKDAGKYSRTRCFSRIKDKMSFDSNFKDNSWRSRTAGNLIFTTHAHFNLLTGKLPDIRALIKTISPSLKAFPFYAVPSLNLKLNSIQAECHFCKGKKSFSIARAMTSSTDGLYPPATDLNSLVVFWMPGVVVPLDIKFVQTSDVISTNQAKILSFCWTTKYFTNTSLNIHSYEEFFIFANTTCFA